MMSKQLPDSLSGLLRLAVADSQAQVAAGVVLDMGLWASQSLDGACYACMAGCVMLNTLNAKFDDENNCMMPGQFGDKSIAMKLHAINDLRCGSIFEAAKCLHLEIPREVAHTAGDMIEQSFRTSTDRADWEVYLQAADYLEKEGF